MSRPSGEQEDGGAAVALEAHSPSSQFFLELPQLLLNVLEPGVSSSGLDLVIQTTAERLLLWNLL